MTYERFVIGATAFCVLGLCVYVLTNRPVSAYQWLPTVAVDGKVDRAKPKLSARPVPVMLVSSSDKLSDVFDRIGYRLEGVRRNGQVPRLFLASLPRDLSRIRVPAKRKVMFIKSALPLILHVNELILAERKRVIVLYAVRDSGLELSREDAAWLDATRKRYDLDALDFDELLRRIDIIPPSLAVAQAAEESGWGTSRFAREGNALFGQRVYRGQRGIVPMKRDKGARHRIRTFDHLIDGVKAYADNLNTHPAYSAFRAARNKLRRDGSAIDGDTLAKSLVRYSERREAYVASIRKIIRSNGLGLFDRARLGDRLTIILSDPGA